MGVRGCHDERVSCLSRRSLGALVFLCLLGAACTDDGGFAATTTTSVSPTTLATSISPGDETPDRGVWPVDPAELTGDQPATWEVEVLSVIPHDPQSYTQGLELSGDVLVESVGRYGQSEIRLVEPLTGDVLNATDLADDHFGEGATVVGSTIIQLTWREGIALVWSLADLALLDQFTYAGEGWGLCAQPDRLVMSDGSSTLTFRDRDDFGALGTIGVTRSGIPVERLNELECVDDFVMANVYLSDEIVVIDPDDGRVVATVDASALGDVIDRPDDDGAVLNGIARWTDDSLVLGGKWWPAMAEVRFVTG